MPRVPPNRQVPDGVPPDSSYDEEAWPRSITELQRLAQQSRKKPPPGREKPWDEATEESSGHAPERERSHREGAARPHEPLDVRVGRLVAARVKESARRMARSFQRFTGGRVSVLVGAALVVGALIGGVFAVIVRQASTDTSGRVVVYQAPQEPLRTMDAPGQDAAPLPGPPGSLQGSMPPQEHVNEPRVAPTPAPAPTAPPPGGPAVPATLVVLSEPFGADILIDGQATGLKTPDTIEGLVPGRTYRLTLTRKGYKVYEEDVVIAQGGKIQVQARLEPTRGRGRR